MASFCENLRQLRGSQSQSAFAKSIGLKQQRYANYESGLREPDLTTLRCICLGTGITSDWLLGLSERGGSAATATANGAHSIAVAGTGAKVTAGGDCAKCKLMQAHIREITGRG